MKVQRSLITKSSSSRHYSSEKSCFTGFSEDASIYWLQIGYTCHLATIRDGCSVNDIFKLLRHF